MLARLRMSLAAAMRLPPIHEANTGKRLRLTSPARASATSSGRMCGSLTMMMSTPSNSRLARQISIARVNRSRVALPRMSMGLLRLQWGGRISSSWAMISSGMGAGSRLYSARVSAAMMPGPPPLVMIARREPAGRGCLAISSAQSNKRASVGTRTMPARLKAAS